MSATVTSVTASPYPTYESIVLPRRNWSLGFPRKAFPSIATKIHVVLLLATPTEQPAQHLQLLQRVCSLLPAIRDELLAQPDADRVLRLIARAEQQSALPTYLNLTQEQIGFELETDLGNGLSAVEARNRLAHYGRNVLQRSRREPWYLKLVRNLFSFFAILLWIAALLCFIPGVDLPQLGIAILMVILVNGILRLPARIQIRPRSGNVAANDCPKMPHDS